MAKTNIPNAWNRLDVLSYLDQLYNNKKTSNMYKATAIHFYLHQGDFELYVSKDLGFFHNVL